LSKAKLRHKIKHYMPDEKDPLFYQKVKFIRYMEINCMGRKRAMPIYDMLIGSRLNKRFGRERFQQVMLGAFRKHPFIFIGTCNKGIYLVVSKGDYELTAHFYKKRIASERAHLLRLKQIAKDYDF